MSTQAKTTIATALRNANLGLISQEEARRIILNVYLNGVQS